jgi:predicted DNA-binding protein with PD1-like motif
MSAQAAHAASFTVGRTLVATPRKGTDLLAEIERLVLEKDIAFCRIEAIGSLDRAAMTYYDQSAQGDREIDVDRPVMLLTASGTALGSDAGVQVHCHLVLGDALGMASGGDLSPGCVVFSCELILQELVGPAMARALDPATGLSPLGPVPADGA